MSARTRRLLWAILALGLIARLAVAFATYGVRFDIDSYGLVSVALRQDPLHVYSDVGRWPYPPGYFAWILLAGKVEGLTGLRFVDLVQVPPILADLAIAWLVQMALGWRGASERARLAAAALVALGPMFFVVSGFHGQIDSIAILPALAAILLWMRLGDHPRRALAVGLLIGAGALVKTVPLVAVLALLPWVRSAREGATLVTAAALLPVASLLPFAIADPSGVWEAVSYRGVPGVGGLSLVAQPDLARAWINEAAVEGSGLTFALLDYGGLVTAAGLALATYLLMRYRPEPLVGAALVYLSLWVFGVNFFLQYVIWGMPFMLAAGYLKQVGVLQLLMLPAAVLVYLRPWEQAAAAWIYAGLGIVLWLMFAGALAVAARRVRDRAATT